MNTRKILTLSDSDKQAVRNAGGFGWQTLRGNRLRSRVLPGLGKLKKGQNHSYESQAFGPRPLVVSAVSARRVSRPPAGDSSSLTQLLGLPVELIDRDGDVKCPHCRNYNWRVKPGEVHCADCGKLFKAVGDAPAEQPQRRYGYGRPGGYGGGGVR